MSGMLVGVGADQHDPGRHAATAAWRRKRRPTACVLAITVIVALVAAVLEVRRPTTVHAVVTFAAMWAVLGVALFTSFVFTHSGD